MSACVEGTPPTMIHSICGMCVCVCGGICAIFWHVAV